MRPILFSAGSLTFYSYGFFTALGFIAAGWFICYLARRKRLVTNKLREYFLVDGLLFSLITGIVAARLCYIVLYNYIFQIETVNHVTNLLGGGFVFYGGFIAALLFFSWWLKRENEPLLPWLDLIIIGLFIGLALSEVGGYLNDNLVVHVALSIGSLALACLCYAILVTEGKPGQSFWSGLFLLLLLDFFAGFWRMEYVLWYGLTLTQWVSFAAMAIYGLFNRRLFNPKE